MKLLKITLLASILLANVTSVFAQDNNKAYLFCKYSFKSIPDSNDRKRVSDDVVGLEIGKRGSRFYSICHEEQKQKVAEAQKSGTKLDPSTIVNYVMKGCTPLNIYKNYSINKITSIDRIARNYYTFDEETPTFDWAIQTDTMKILDQICQKATCQFKGRNYEAWFAPEINVSEGPWKFNGLPGLILKIKDSRNDYVFEAIEIKKVDNEIVAGNNVAQKVSKEKFLSIYKYYLIDPMMGVNIKDINPNMPKEFYDKLGKAKLPYNPIELTDK